MAAVRDSLPRAIGAAVRARRTGLGWTLDQLASRSGVSRRLIIQVEKGDANPSIDTLLRLATALGVALSELVAAPALVRSGLVSTQQSSTLWRGPRGGRAKLLIGHGPVELWSWTLAPHEARRSRPHQSGSIELVRVEKGSLVITAGSQELTVTAPDAAWFDAAQPHAYRNHKAAACAFTLVVFDPPGVPAP